MARLRWLAVFCFAVLIAAVAPEVDSRRRVAPFQKDQASQKAAHAKKEALAKKGKGAKGPPVRPPGAGRKPPPPRPKGGKADPRAAWPKPKKPSFGNSFGKGPKGKSPEPRRRRAGSKGKSPPGKSWPRGQKNPPPGKGWPKRRPVDPKLIEAKKLLEFQLVDADHDGRLTAAEAEAANASLSARHEEKETLKDWEIALRYRMTKDDWFEIADADKDGSLAFEEYKQTAKDRARMQDLHQLQEAQFKLVDADGDGELTVDEVAVAKEALDAKRSKQVEAMKAKLGKPSDHKMERFESMLLRRLSKEGWMQAVDLNGDGKLVFDEFKLFKKIEPKAQEL